MTDIPWHLLGDERIFVRVYVLPPPDQLTDGYCFQGGRPISFLNVDWFTVDSQTDPGRLAAFIRKKGYFAPHRRYLVLGDKPDLTFTLDPDPDHRQQ